MLEKHADRLDEGIFTIRKKYDTLSFHECRSTDSYALKVVMHIHVLLFHHTCSMAVCLQRNCVVQTIKS